jgi:hypothetical protein
MTASPTKNTVALPTHKTLDAALLIISCSLSLLLCVDGAKRRAKTPLSRTRSYPFSSSYCQW